MALYAPAAGGSTGTGLAAALVLFSLSLFIREIRC